MSLSERSLNTGMKFALTHPEFRTIIEVNVLSGIYVRSLLDRVNMSLTITEEYLHGNIKKKIVKAALGEVENMGRLFGGSSEDEFAMTTMLRLFLEDWYVASERINGHFGDHSNNIPVSGKQLMGALGAIGAVLQNGDNEDVRFEMNKAFNRRMGDPLLASEYLPIKKMMGLCDPVGEDDLS